MSLTLVALCLPSLYASDDAMTIATQASEKALRAQSDGEEWTYQIVVKNKETRSEAWHGILTKNGKQVIGKADEVIESPFGKLAWFGVPESSDEAFANRGWLNALPFGRRVFDESGKRIQE